MEGPYINSSLYHWQRVSLNLHLKPDTPMRTLPILVLLLVLQQVHGQYPFVKKLNYPDQLPTQVVYDMLTDKKGYIWVGTDKGLFRFNGKNFVPIPFDNTSSKAVSYLQEDNDGTIWCMNFYNQLFSYKKDTLRRFVTINGLKTDYITFNNVVVTKKHVWFNSFNIIRGFDKKTGNPVASFASLTPADKPGGHRIYDQIIASTNYNDSVFFFSNNGYQLILGESLKGKWTQSNRPFANFGFINDSRSLMGIGTALERKPGVEIRGNHFTELTPIALQKDIFLFHGVALGNDEYWLCTQKGAYQWNKQTGETRCYLPNERVTDVVRDYQGNYWFSTLDDGILVCTSLYSTLLKIYKNPLLDNFTKITLLPSGEIVAGNSQGMLVKYNLETGAEFRYNVARSREVEFINYDSARDVIFFNRGVVRSSQKNPLEVLDYNKGIARDIYGNLILAVFNGAYVMNDKVGSIMRHPYVSCELYKKYRQDTFYYDGNMRGTILLRQKRSLTVQASSGKEGFWIAYEDGLYHYEYNGTVTEWLDEEGKPVIARALIQLDDGSLLAGTTNKGLILFQRGKPVKHILTRDGLSSNNIRKLLKQYNAIWVLTDEGIDRINGIQGNITNFFEEYGLNSMVINDFTIGSGKIIIATTTGILVRYNLPRFYNPAIRFPYLRAMNNGNEVEPGSTLSGKSSDVIFNFEAVHFLSSSSLAFTYRLKGLDTTWHTTNGFVNQLFFNRLAPGKYVFEIMAKASPNYQSEIRSFAFEVPRPFWRRTAFFLMIVLLSILLLWVSLRQWKMTLLQKQEIKEELLKSQLVALRAQMNPHFLYNVLNTVQGLVYGNRKTEAGALLGNFSDLMRKTLQASDKQLLPLKDEIENIRLYLELEKARYEEGFSYELSYDDIEDLSSTYVPSLMLQPFVENAVKHGLLHKQGDKKVSIRFEKQPDGLQVTIDDNGIGRAQSMEINRRRHNKPFSFATVALNERMELFNRLYKEKIRCRIIDKFDSRQLPSGTRVELFIPDYSNDPKAL